MAYLKHASQEYVDAAIAAESSDRATAIATAKAYLKGLIESESSRASGQEAILQQAINNIQTFEVVIAAALPTASSAYARKIYLIPSSNPKAGNAKDEYICVQTDGAWKWEQIGSTELTLEYDIEPTDGSSKIVKSGGIYAWVKNEIRVLTSWITDRLAEKQATIVDLQTIRNGASAGSTASQPGHTHAQTDVTGLSAALAGKANATALEKIGWKKRGMKDLRVSDFENYDPSDYGSGINYVVRNWTSANAALAEAFAEDPVSINYAPNMVGWFPNSNTVGAWTIAYPAQTTDPDALEVVFECTDPNGVTAQATAHIEVLAKTSELPSPAPAPVAPTPDAAAGSYAGAPETAAALEKRRAIDDLVYWQGAEQNGVYPTIRREPAMSDYWVADFESGPGYVGDTSSPTATSIVFTQASGPEPDPDWPETFTVTRQRLIGSGLSDQGVPLDPKVAEFFADSNTLLTSRIGALTKTNAESAATATNAVTLNDNAPKTVTVATVESPATPSLAVTFANARQSGGLRICELYILNGTADTDLTFDSSVQFVCTGDSFPACESGINYFVFAEVAANLWKVTRETLKSITTPTPVAAA